MNWKSWRKTTCWPSSNRSEMEQKAGPRLKLNTWLLPILAGVLLVLQIVSPYRGWVVFLVGLGGMWLASYVWAQILARGLQFTRVMRFGWAQVGDQLEERFKLTNAGAVPALWVEVVDHSTVPGYLAGWTTEVEAKRVRRWSRSATCTRRGLFTLGPTTLLTGDPFGVYTVSLHYPASMPFLILPPVLSLPTIRVSPGGLSGEGRPRPNAPERTISASSVREYNPGDSRRWIHWRTTARKESLYVRLFDGTPAGDWWIVLDMDQSAQVGEGDDSTEEHGVVLAASLADRGLQMRRAVGLVMHGQDLVWLPPKGGDTQRWEILRDLALAAPGSRPLSKLLMRMRPKISQHASLIVITPATDNVWIEALVPLMKRGAVPTVLLLDPASFGGEGDASETADLLARLGVTHYIITPDVLNRSEARPAWPQTWGWEILDSGHVAPVSQPQDVAWRVLA
jgi:uncharacterized protein (DUF58 family)